MLRLWLLASLLLLALPLALYVISPLWTIGYLYLWLMLALYGHGRTIQELNALKAANYAD